MLLGHLTQKPGNVTGKGKREPGHQELFFLGFGVWGRDSTEKNPVG